MFIWEEKQHVRLCLEVSGLPSTAILDGKNKVTAEGTTMICHDELATLPPPFQAICYFCLGLHQFLAYSCVSFLFEEFSGKSLGNII